MLKTLMVGIDGSEYSQYAVDLGIAWAKRFDALLVGLGIVDQPGLCGYEAVPLGGGAFKAKLDETRLKHATTVVEQALERFSIKCAEAGVASKPLEVVGDPVQCLTLEAQRYDLIVLGKRTYFHLDDADTHTVDHLLKSPPRPVVSVPRQTNQGDSVVIAYDGSLQSTRAIQAFCASGLAALAKHVHVVTMGTESVAASRIADRAVEYLSFHDIKAQPHVITDTGDVAARLALVFNELNACLGVIGCYGQSAIREFFLGSVTRSMLERATIPLFIYQ